MKKSSIPLLCLIITRPLACWAYAAAGGNSQALQASNILNPNISVTGWLQAEAGDRSPASAGASAFDLKELELAFQSVVDAYAKADVFIAIHNGEIDVEEGYIEWFRLPFNVSIKAGKFLANFGKFNRIHSPETAFASRPFAHDAFFGKEGLSGTGGSVSWLLPNPLFYTNLDVEIMNTPKGADVPAFEEARKKDLTFVSRLGSFFDLSESANIAVGFDYANGAAGEEFDAVSHSSETLRSLFYGFDVTFHWKNPRRAIYHSLLWQTEVFWNARELSVVDTNTSRGLFSHLEYQLARRWRIGGRYDYAENPLDGRSQEQGGLLYATFMPSEFSLVSLQGQHKNFDDNTDENLGFLKVTFNIGPHGQHPF